MNLINCEPKFLFGITIRTRNEDEKHQELTKIPGLWKNFYTEIYQKALNGEVVYGVYSDYEIDHTGYFNISAAVEKKCNGIDLKQKGIKQIELKAGKYLKFTPKTEESSIWQLWEQVWVFFSTKNQKLERAYTTDYEVFYPNKKVELYIAVK